MTHTGQPAADTRLGGRPAAGSVPGCADCHHPLALHGNGATACRAWACTAGPAVTCPSCNGTQTAVPGGDKPCPECKGSGSVATPCQSYKDPGGRSVPGAELLAS